MVLALSFRSLFLVFFLILGSGLHDVSFSPGLCKGSFTAPPPPPLSAPTPNTLDTPPVFNLPTPQPHAPLDGSMCLDKSWAFYNFIGGGQTGVSFPHTVHNPNKAVVTIHARTSKVRGKREGGVTIHARTSKVRGVGIKGVTCWG